MVSPPYRPADISPDHLHYQIRDRDITFSYNLIVSRLLMCFFFFFFFFFFRIPTVLVPSSYSKKVCINPKHCKPCSWGDPHLTSALDPRTVNCGCQGVHTYLNNSLIEVTARHTALSSSNRINVISAVSASTVLYHRPLSYSNLWYCRHMQQYRMQTQC